MAEPPGRAQLPTTFSPDGYWWWDGNGWKPALSPDGSWRWNGQAWIPAHAAQPPSRRGLSTGALVGLIAGVTAVVLVVVAVLGYVAVSRFSGQTPVVTQTPTNGHSAVTSIPCDQLEHTQVHYHAALQILYRGQLAAIPTTIGRSALCYYWLHMHTGEPGIIHVEAPADQTFTLGDFFAVWGAWGAKAQPLDLAHVSSFVLAPDQKLVVYVDGGSGDGPRLFTGDPKTIVLADHEVITLEIIPPAVAPPPAFAWPSGF
jgi:hypothetical protein